MGVVQSKRGAKVNVRKPSRQTKNIEDHSDGTKNKAKKNKNKSKTDIRLQVTTAEGSAKKDKHHANGKPPSRESNKIFWRRFSKSSESSKGEEQAVNTAKQTEERQSSSPPLSSDQKKRKNSYTIESKDCESDKGSENNIANILNITGNSSFAFAEDEIVDVHQVYNFINDGSVKVHLCDPSYLLILDTRETTDYDKSHIITARHSEVVYSGYFSLSAFNYGFLGTQTNLSEFAIIVVYGNKVDLDNIDPESPEMKLFKELKSYDVEPSIMLEGYEGFYSQYPFLCSDVSQIPDAQRIQIKTYPSAVLPNQLYQGRGSQATDEKIVKDLKITHIVNISNEHQNAFTDFIKYLSINVEDLSTSKILAKLPQSTNFITNAVNEGGRVMVHCHLGVSRSSTVTIAYLMKSREWSLKKAHTFLREQRTCVRPNVGFLKQLSDWEETLFDKRITDIDELWY